MQKIPVTLGIVGHIDAIITDEHKAKIKAIFTDIAKKYPNSPLVLFSQLARGADTVVAELFLEVKAETGKDCRLVVPIPYYLDVYKTSQFKTAEDLKRFEDLLSKAERHFVLNTLTEVEKKGGKSKGEFYRKGTKFVADSSIVLIALWDGVFEDGKSGGTGDTVYYKKNNSYKNEVSDTMFDDEGGLIIVPCNREKTQEKKEIALIDNYLENLLKEKPVLKDAMDKIEALNQPKYNDVKIDYEGENKYTKLLEDYRKMAAEIASNNHGEYNRTVNRLFLISLLFVVFWEMYVSFGNVYAFWFMLCALAVGIFLMWWYDMKRYHKNYIDNRMLAEALRVQMYWHMRGMRESVARYVLRAHTRNYSWAKHVLNAIYGYTIPETNQRALSVRYVAEKWFDEQIKFFLKKIKEIQKSIRFFSVLFNILLGFGILMVIAIFFLSVYADIDFSWMRVQYVSSLMIMFAFFAKAYADKKAYQNLYTEYELMLNIFNKAKKQMENILSWQPVESEGKRRKEENINKVFLKVGKEALLENARWYVVYKDRKAKLEID